MGDLPKQIAAEMENVETALRNLEETLEREAKTVVELAAIGTFLHNIYNGIENILKQSLKSKNIQLDRGDQWHKELLVLSVKNDILSSELADDLYEYLTFRHYFVHAYGFMLEAAPLEPLTQKIPKIWAKFVHEISRCRN